MLHEVAFGHLEPAIGDQLNECESD
jgi:hypothetical protein